MLSFVPTERVLEKSQILKLVYGGAYKEAVSAEIAKHQSSCKQHSHNTCFWPKDPQLKNRDASFSGREVREVANMLSHVEDCDLGLVPPLA